MMQSLLCSIADHKYPIDAICMNKECPAEHRILCIQCVQQYHTKCNFQYSLQSQFLDALKDLKSQFSVSQNAIAQKEAFQALKNQIIQQLGQLEDMVNKNLDDETNKIQALKRIDLILNTQLTKETWMDGYDLLTKTDQIPFDQSVLNTQIDRLKQSLESISDIANQSIQKVQQAFNGDWKYITKDKPFTIDVNRRLFYQDSMTCSPDGRYLGVDNNFALELWNLQNGVKIGSLMGHIDYIMAIEFSKCGNFVISGGFDKTIKIWDIKTMKQIGQNLEGHNDYIISVQYSEHEDYILSGSQDQTIRIWEVQSQKEIEEKRFKHEQQVNDVSPIQFSPKRDQFLVGNHQQQIIIYDFKNQKQFGNPLIGHTSNVYGAKWSADSKLIVSSGNDKTIRIWSVETQTQIGILYGHQNIIIPVVFSPDMNYVLSGSDDQTLRLWNWRKGTQVGNNIPGHNNYVRCTKFSPNGRYIISADQSGHIQIAEAVF